MEEIQKYKDKLKEYGFDDHKLDVLMALAFEEFMATFRDDLEKLELSDLTQLESEMSSLTLNELMNPSSDKTSELLSRVYGLSAKNKVESFIVEYLKDAVEQAEIAKDFATKLKTDDPAKVMASMNLNTEDANQDSIATAVKVASEL